MRYHYKVSKGEALRALKGLLDAGETETTGAALEVLRTPRLASAKAGFGDRLIHGGYLKSGQPMARAGKLEGVRVLGAGRRKPEAAGSICIRILNEVAPARGTVVA